MKKYLMFAAVAMAMAACSSNDEGPAVAQNDTIELTTGVARTRATSQLIQSTQIENGQNVWVEATSSVLPTQNTGTGSGQWSTTGPTYTASCVYVGNGIGNLSSASPIKWPKNLASSGTETVDIKAWAPFSAAVTPNTTTFEVRADQTTEADYLASDYLYAEKTGIVRSDITSPVALTFSHMLSKINVNLFAIDPTATPIDGATVEFGPATLEHQAVIGLNGTVTKNNAVQGKVTLTSSLEAAHTCSAIIIPQLITASVGTPTVLFTITLPGTAGIKYYQLTTNKSYDPKKEYTYNITISDGETIVLSEQITDWVEGGPESVIAN